MIDLCQSSANVFSSTYVFIQRQQSNRLKNGYLVDGYKTRLFEECRVFLSGISVGCWLGCNALVIIPPPKDIATCSLSDVPFFPSESAVLPSTHFLFLNRVLTPGPSGVLLDDETIIKLTTINLCQLSVNVLRYLFIQRQQSNLLTPIALELTQRRLDVSLEWFLIPFLSSDLFSLT